MSFGFSIGDFAMVIERVNKIRKEFVDAPSQFGAISDEYDTLDTLDLELKRSNFMAGK